MKKYEVDWLKILEEIASADLIGHETWFVVGYEQHGAFFYCAIGDCTITPEDTVKTICEEFDKDSSELEKILLERNRFGLVYIGKSRLSYEDAVREALTKALRPIGMTHPPEANKNIEKEDK